MCNIQYENLPVFLFDLFAIAPPLIQLLWNSTFSLSFVIVQQELNLAMI